MPLVADRLSMRYGRQRLFEALSFTVEAGAPLAVVGRNGSGKSTLVRVLAGVLTPLSGEVRLETTGRVVDRETLPREVGMVAPALQLYDPLTARENLHFLCDARRLPRDRAAPVLDRVGLGDRADEPVAQLSTGMKQRLRVASALLHDPPVLLLDEPGATLDAEGRALVASVIASPDRIVVVATNDPDEADQCARRLTLGATG